ncbi:sigma-54 dependent transcriptional regulator [Thioalkalivibrio sp. XN8]|uniref:sigma-54-dependent transcriptional regulator n=1 Tax=Thioalkalivibrio sp. XN8 TaxID=2712863 RepID=UPI0013ECCC6F|nr:sigma-54 dependent transcriptional regulator [Thioalkalivibrio sp. XN8]NGP54026.1 sigma-54-dependent Fis family transcriptional regulator [Thioalkalivibrio sp. XN8]
MQLAADNQASDLRGASVLIVGGGPDFRSQLRQAMRRHVALVDSAEGALKASQLMARCHFGFLVVNAELPDAAAVDWLDELAREGVQVRAAVLAEPGQAPGLQQALAGRTAAVLTRPLELDALLEALRRLGVQAAEPAAAPRLQARDGIVRDRDLVGDSPQMCEVRDLVQRIAPLPGTVLIEGETGTGKELVARWLHVLSMRRGQFVAVNCGAIAPELLESELFGHTKGAFTSAHQEREGLFVAARGGTLYLDEISEMPFSLQVKLLRVLEEGALRPVGGDREVPVDVRVLASTQHELPALVQERRFREDLYFRLNVAQVNLAPLRDRVEDIAVLAAHFMGRLSATLGVAPLPLTPEAMQRLQRYRWPGNVRELKNFIERSLMLGGLALDQLRILPEPDPVDSGAYPLDWTLEQVKQHHMARVLRAVGGNKSAAARRLGVSRKTLERRLPGGGHDNDTA